MIILTHFQLNIKIINSHRNNTSNKIKDNKIPNFTIIGKTHHHKIRVIRIISSNKAISRGLHPQMQITKDQTIKKVKPEKNGKKESRIMSISP